MKIISIFIFLLLVSSCLSEHKDLKVTEDLPFHYIMPNIEEQAISDSRIKGTIITVENPTLGKNPVILGYQYYDSLGRIIIQNEIVDYGPYIKNEYDSLGNLFGKEYVTDFIACYVTKNKFYPREKKLLQTWHRCGRLATKSVPLVFGEVRDTTIFYFSDNGLLQSEQGAFHNDSEGIFYSKNFRYNTDYKVISIIYLYDWTAKGDKGVLVPMSESHNLWEFSLTNKVEEHFQYTSNLLAEKQTTYWHADTIKLESITFYDSLGLKERTIIKNKEYPIIKYIHTTEDSLVRASLEAYYDKKQWLHLIKKHK